MKHLKKIFNLCYVIYGIIIIVIYPYILAIFGDITRMRYYIERYFLFINTEHADEYLKIIISIILILFAVLVFIGIYVHVLARIYVKNEQTNIKRNLFNAICGYILGIISSIIFMYIISLAYVHKLYINVLCFIPFTYWEIKTITQNIIIILGGVLVLGVAVSISTNMAKKKIKYIE